jgi:hypothetical protein
MCDDNDEHRDRRIDTSSSVDDATSDENDR